MLAVLLFVAAVSSASNARLLDMVDALQMDGVYFRTLIKMMEGTYKDGAGRYVGISTACAVATQSLLLLAD